MPRPTLRSMSAALVACLALVTLVGSSACGDDGTTAVTTYSWYSTCGDPVCSGYTAPADVPACEAEQVGATCEVAGVRCDPVDSCNALLICASSDPKDQPGGCPISERARKRDIVPVDAAERARLAQAVHDLPLSTWRYRTDPEGRPARLGFMLDEVAGSAGQPAVDTDRGVVDLYGLLSMTVAALQVQGEELEALRAEVAALRHRSCD